MKVISKDKILLVDDDPMVLEGMRALFHGCADINTASDAGEGLTALRTNGPYAVLVSDFKMPGMDGIEFLSRTREIAPSTVRIMLTGYAQADTAIAAVNTGEVFRFHTKPCPSHLLRKTISDALDKFHSIHAARIDNIAFSLNIEDSKSGHNDGIDRPLWKVLTSKELRVADLIRMDLSSKEIATFLNISVRTVETHRDNIRKKLGIANRKINLQNYLSFIAHR